MTNQKAFTLIELMIAVVIVGVLTAIAYPAYQDSVMKSRRGDAKGALVNFANTMERRFTEVNSYCDLADAGGSTVTGCGTGTNDTGAPTIIANNGVLSFYSLTINAVTASSYTLIATPTGAQSADKCGTLTITNTGVRGISGAATGVTVASCW